MADSPASIAPIAPVSGQSLPDGPPELAGLIRAMADFPQPGVIVRDVRPLLADAAA